jgi:hypothetical protein
MTQITNNPLDNLQTEPKTSIKNMGRKEHILNQLEWFDVNQE